MRVHDQSLHGKGPDRTWVDYSAGPAVTVALVSAENNRESELGGFDAQWYGLLSGG